MPPTAGAPGSEPGSRRPLSAMRRLVALLVAVGGLPLLTVVLVPMRDTLSLPSEMLLFLLLVVTVALVGGLAPAVFAAVAAVLLLNWYFTPPLGTLTIAQRDHVIALIVFVAVAVLVSVVVEVAAASAIRADRADAETQLVARLAEEAPAEVGLSSVLHELTNTFPLAGVRVEEQAGPEWTPVMEIAGGQPPPDSFERVLPVPGDATLRLVLVGPPQFAEDGRLLDRFAAAVGTAVRSSRLAEQAARADRLAAAEALRTTLLAAVGHDLRTPLSGIKAAASSLRQSDVAWSEEEQAELHATIEESADQLDRLLTNLLDLSRLEAGSVSAVLEPITLDGTVAEAIRSVGSPPLRWEIPDDLPAVLADPGLLERVVANLVANAVQHGGAGHSGSGLIVRAHEDRQGAARMVQLSVVDSGPGVAAGDLDRIFAPFQRLDDHGRGEGLGLGLAVARGLLDAMGATIAATPTPGGGLTVAVRLPVADPPADGAARVASALRAQG